MKARYYRKGGMRSAPQYEGYKNWSTWNLATWLKSTEENRVACILKARQHNGKMLPWECKRWIVDTVYPNGTPDMVNHKELGCVKWSEICSIINELYDKQI